MGGVFSVVDVDTIHSEVIYLNNVVTQLAEEAFLFSVGLSVAVQIRVWGLTLHLFK